MHTQIARVVLLVLALAPGCGGARVQLRSVLSAAVTPDGAIWYVMTEEGGASGIFRCIGDDPEQGAAAECSRVVPR